MDVAEQFSKILGLRGLIAVRGPPQQESTVRSVHHNLEYPGRISAVRDGIQKTLVENAGLLLIHRIRSTPIFPACFGVLIIVVGPEVNPRVYEAEDETLRGPIDDEIGCHEDGINSYFILIRPMMRWALVAKEAAHAGEERITHSDGEWHE